MPAFRRLSALLLPLLLTAIAAKANHGVAALGAAVEALFLGLLFISALNFVLGLINIRYKKKWIRAINIIFLIPIALVSLLLFGIAPEFGIVGLIVLFIFGIVIYKGYARPTV